MPEKTAILTDAQVIDLVLNDNPDYFEELVIRYKNLVYSVVLRMITDKEEARDLASEVFIKAYKNLSLYSSAYKFSTWLMRIATNHVIDYRRKKKQETVSLSELEYELTDGKSPESVYLENEYKQNVNALFDVLPDVYKIPIALYHKEGLSYREISEIINEPLSKVKNRIFRGRKMLKEYITGTKVGEYFGV